MSKFSASAIKAAMAGAILLAWVPFASAGDRVHWSVSVGSPGYYSPPPVIYTPPPTVYYSPPQTYYYNPPPVYYNPPPAVIYRPAPVVTYPYPQWNFGYSSGYRHHHHHRHDR